MVSPRDRFLWLLLLAFPVLMFVSCGGGSTITSSAASPMPPVTPTPPGPTPPGGAAITACGQRLNSGTSYYLANSIGNDPGAKCLTLTGPNLVLNLNGYAVTGTLKGAGIDTNGLHIYGGTVNCKDSDPTFPGCIYISSDSNSFTALLEVDHLNLANSATTSAESSRNLMIDVGSISQSTVPGPNIKIHDNTSTSATGISSSRIVNLQVQGTAHRNAGYAEFYNNHAVCQSTAAACQGVVAYGLWNTKVHDNNLANQRSNAASTETARAIICDQTDGCEIYANTIDAQDGRAVRMRGTSKVNGANSVHDNLVNNVVAGSNPNTVAAFHLGDPDSGTEVENATIYNNTINVFTGWVFMARSVTAITLRDNVVNGAGPISLLDSRSGAATQVDLLRTQISGGTATSSCEPGTTVTICKSGVAIGACSIANSAC